MSTCCRSLHIRAFTVSILLCCSITYAAGEANSSNTNALDLITSQDLQTHVNFLASPKCDGRASGTAGSRAAAEYIRAELNKYGIKGMADGDAYDQAFAPKYNNIIGVIPGSDPQLQNQYIVLCAHYDHVGHGTKENSRGPIGQIHPGADDNASGVAALLELAKAITALPQHPPRSIILAFWDGEEDEMLGSKYWIEHPTVKLDHVLAAINVDMIGRLREDQLTVYGSRTGFGFRRLVSEQNTRFNLKIDYSWEMEDDGDQYPFFQNEIPVLFVHTGVHDEYHSPKDTADKINSDGMCRVTQLLFKIVNKLAATDQSLSFRIASKSETEKDHQQFEDSFDQLPARFGVRTKKTKSDNGVLLTAVADDSPAAKAGIQPGDRIIQFANYQVRSKEDLTSAVMLSESQSDIVVRRDNARNSIKLHVQLDSKPLRLGFTWRDDDAEPGTVIVTYVAPNSLAAKSGLKPSDRIYQVNEKNFRDTVAFMQLIHDIRPENMLFSVERDGQIHAIPIASIQYAK